MTSHFSPNLSDLDPVRLQTQWHRSESNEQREDIAVLSLQIFQSIMLTVCILIGTAPRRASREGDCSGAFCSNLSKHYSHCLQTHWHRTEADEQEKSL